MVHTSTTAQNMVKNFQETVKIYEQGKKYYDALKSVNNLVRDAHLPVHRLAAAALHDRCPAMGWMDLARNRGMG